MKKYFRWTGLLLAISLFVIGSSQLKAVAFGKGDRSSYEKVDHKLETIYPEYNFKELSDLSDVVVVAKFKGYTNPFRVIPFGGGEPFIYKDAKFEIQKVYKGDVSEKSVITVRTLGGEVIDDREQIIYSLEENEDFKFNNKHLKVLFLANPTADPYKTREDYYELMCGPNGAFELEEDQLVNIVNPSKTYALMSLEEIDPTINPEVLDREQMDSNLQEGYITQEEYDQYFESLDQYGKRID